MATPEYICIPNIEGIFNSQEMCKTDLSGYVSLIPPPVEPVMAQQSPYYSTNEETYNITINWIRHGESCANLATKGFQDKKDPDSDISYGDGYGITGNGFETNMKNGLHKDIMDKEIDITNTEIQEFELIDHPIGDDSLIDKEYQTFVDTWMEVFNTAASKMKGTFMYEPNLSYVGMSHAINLGTNFFSKNEHSNHTNIYISSALTRTITTALLALRFVSDAVIYVVPYINEINNSAEQFGIDFQNTAVKSSILKKKILFIKKWLDINWITYFDDIEIINFLITIYEIIDISNNADAEKVKNTIIKVLNCRKYIGCRRDNYTQLQDYVLELLQMENLDSYLIKDNNTKYTLVTNFIKKAQTLVSNLTQFKHGPTVNFEIYDYYEQLRTKPRYKDIIPDTTISNINFFLTDVLKIIYRDIKFPKNYQIYPKNLNKLEDGPREDITIYAFAHGSLIRQIWREFHNKEDKSQSYGSVAHELDKMMNTAVISDIITLTKDLHRILEHNFTIIHTPEKIRSTYYNFEKYHPDVCKLQSIKGIINFPLYYDTLDTSKVAVFKQKYPPDKNSEFFYNNMKPYTNNLPLVIEGYERKYLKYKQKYLDLKKHNL